MASDIPPMLPAVATHGNTEGSNNVGSVPDMAYDKEGDAKRLKAIYERIVVSRGETRAAFGRRSGLGKAANVGHYLNGKNSLSVDSARKFAAAIPCKIEDFSLYWARMAYASGQVAVGEKLDPHNHGGVIHVAEPLINKFLETSGKDLTPILKLPMITWGQVGLMSEPNECLIGVQGVDFVDAEGEHVGSRTKFVLMPDDSMSPRIEEGDRLTIEPDWKAEPGEIVLVRDNLGEHYIRRYKAVRAGHFIAEPANSTDYQSLDSIELGLEVIGVVVARREFLAKRRR